MGAAGTNQSLLIILGVLLLLSGCTSIADLNDRSRRIERE